MRVLIETPRLTMREFCLADIDEVYEFSTDPEVTRYTGDAGSVKTKEDAKKIITDIWQVEYQKYGYARYALIHKADDRIIGFCGMKYEPEIKGPDIGYRMLPKYWGKGLGTEAAKASLEYAKNVLQLNRIIGDAVVENIGSNRILQKLGFDLIGNYEFEEFEVNRYEYFLIGKETI